jgi:hypothetical protein
VPFALVATAGVAALGGAILWFALGHGGDSRPGANTRVGLGPRQLLLRTSF